MWNSDSCDYFQKCRKILTRVAGATKPDGLRVVPGTHWQEDRSDSCKVSWPPQEHTSQKLDKRKEREKAACTSICKDVTNWQTMVGTVEQRGPEQTYNPWRNARCTNSAGSW